jgi:excinuclease ABC subunit C
MKPSNSGDKDAVLDVSKAPAAPGVYQMFDEAGIVLYVGKAKELKKRLSSYFRENLSPKTLRLMQQVRRIETTVTLSESEALLLECQLIKRYHPRYNILLRDDKSYPYLVVNSEHAFPKVDRYRGSKKKNHQYFGPYPNATAVRETLHLLQKIFRLRSCSDSEFASRSRPCLQYQIGRCSAPCVNYISEKAYHDNLQAAIAFLEGKSQEVIQDLVDKMGQASKAHHYEEAILFRDQIQALRHVLEKQCVETMKGAIDVIAVVSKEGIACIQLLLFRGGRLLGSRSFFPKGAADASESEILTAFVSQYYFSKNHREHIPKEIILGESIEDKDVVMQALKESSGHQVLLKTGVKLARAKWLKMAVLNAQKALVERSLQCGVHHERFDDLVRALVLAHTPLRIECFDISHTQGEGAVGSCVVFSREGPLTAMYRRFLLKDITPGDDYAAMTQVIQRRYQRLQKEGAMLPDIILVDGGKGQLHCAKKVMNELGLENIVLIAISKGAARKAGEETLWQSGKTEPLSISPESSGFHLLQAIRDEAHRFAITGHRAKQRKKQLHSVLEEIEGVGATRRRELLQQFGGLKGVKAASIESLMTSPGISRELASRLYHFFRD